MVSVGIIKFLLGTGESCGEVQKNRLSLILWLVEALALAEVHDFLNMNNECLIWAIVIDSMVHDGPIRKADLEVFCAQLTLNGVSDWIHGGMYVAGGLLIFPLSTSSSRIPLGRALSSLIFTRAIPRSVPMKSFLNKFLKACEWSLNTFCCSNLEKQSIPVFDDFFLMLIGCCDGVEENNWEGKRKKFSFSKEKREWLSFAKTFWRRRGSDFLLRRLFKGEEGVTFFFKWEEGVPCSF